ncbi:sensor histidine kinase [Daejeonella oryzae]|uniref:sensor histidine kinase n=1 Tax=Daejeonella oryzae TaxID=1122943 RepID=UPI00047AF9B9|nr:HAMP domain-containing sensor histidine kinase [Daejeonella oryzae]
MVLTFLSEMNSNYYGSAEREIQNLRKLKIYIIGAMSILLFSTLAFLILTSAPINSLAGIFIIISALITLLVIFLVIRGFNLAMHISADKVSKKEISDPVLISDHYDTEDHLNEKKHFRSILSHDMRSPLSSMILVASMIKEMNKLPDIQPFLEMIEKSARKELDMVGTLLILMNSDAENQKYHEQVSLKNLMDKAINEVREIIPDGKVSLRINIEENPVLQANPDALLLVFKNLLINAMQFSPEGGIVEINGRQDEHNLFVEITDNGPGFIEEKHFFESATLNNPDRFRESEDSIGLYFCSKIIRNHHGTIHAYSDGSDKGARFELVLPRPKENISS